MSDKLTNKRLRTKRDFALGDSVSVQLGKPLGKTFKIAHMDEQYAY